MKRNMIGTWSLIAAGFALLSLIIYQPYAPWGHWGTQTTYEVVEVRIWGE